VYPIVLFDALRVQIRDAGSRTVKKNGPCMSLSASHATSV
jgi:hypothetical protein